MLFRSKAHAASAPVELTGIVGSLLKAKTTICTPARTGMSTARTPAVHGRNTTMAAGQIRAPGPLLMPKVNRVLLRELPPERVLRNGQQLLPGRFNNSTGTLRRARQVRPGRSSSRGPAARRPKVVQEVPDVQHSGELSELCETSGPTSSRCS